MSRPLEYCVLRIVPDIERAEFINTAVVLICRASRFLDCRTTLNELRLQALWPELDGGRIDLVRAHLATIAPICQGDPAGGPIARLDMGARWHWLTAPASTIVQPGPVHTGLAADPAAELDRLFARLVPA